MNEQAIGTAAAWAEALDPASLRGAAASLTGAEKNGRRSGLRIALPNGDAGIGEVHSVSRKAFPDADIYVIDSGSQDGYGCGYDYTHRRARDSRTAAEPRDHVLLPMHVNSRQTDAVGSASGLGLVCCLVLDENIDDYLSGALEHQ